MKNSISRGDFWQAVSNRATAATVVATDGQSGKAGFLALSATHLSASPPRMMVSIDDSTTALLALRENGVFSINCLAKKQMNLLHAFGGKSDLKGADRFTLGRWSSLGTGAPILEEAVAAFDCVVEDEVVQGRTSIIIGELKGFVIDQQAEPYVYFRGKAY